MSKKDSIVKAKGVKKQYKMGKDNFVEALKGVDVEIERGDLVSFIGPSGAGKSTLMHILGCLDVPNEGKVWIDGEEVTAIKETKLYRYRSRKLGFVFQGFNLVPTLTAVENVALAAEYAGQKRKDAFEAAAKLLEDVGLGKRMRHRPSELSGGEQQRTAIARALVNEPMILFADEPTGELDTETSMEIMDLLKDFNKKLKQTVVIVSHNLDVANQCNRVIEMRDGKIVKA